jgi:hypothetical protein
MKKILLFLFLSGCSSGVEEYVDWKKDYKELTYFAMSCPSSDFKGVKSNCGFGASSRTQLVANEIAINKCSIEYSNCVVVKENDNWVYSVEKYQTQKKENEMERFIKQCEQIGFKRNTEKLGECVLKIFETEKKIVQNQVSNSGGGNSVGNLILLQESLKLLNPPSAAPQRNLNCVFNNVGGISGVNCF